MRLCRSSGVSGESSTLFGTRKSQSTFLTYYRSIIGPALGGALSDPCLNYPYWFPKGTIFEKFPYLLPNLVCVAVLVCGVVIGILFLEETHVERKTRRDPGLEAGKLLLRMVFGKADQEDDEKKSELATAFSKLEDASFQERVYLLADDDDVPPGYRTTENSPLVPSTPVETTPPTTPRSKTIQERTIKRNRMGLNKAFTKQVIVIIISYGILA
jgi:hypothetical protein